MKPKALIVCCFALLTAANLFSQQLPGPLNIVPSRIVGHAQPEQINIASSLPNLVEGRELFSPEGIALDTSVSPPILYVADTGNNRVLAWQNALNFKNGQAADLVIGQQDKYHTFAQGPSGTFQSGLSKPTGLAVDGNGNLYIVDTNNNRILRYPKPFANVPGAGQLEQPDLYIGQPNLNNNRANFTGQVGDQGLNLLGSLFPVGIALDQQGNLWVSDGGNRRVLRFAATDLASGGGPLRANLVLGQVDFASTNQPVPTSSSLTAPNAFAVPISVAVDAAGNLYVTDSSADASVSRVLVFKPPFVNNQSAARIMGVPVTTSIESQDKSIMGWVSSPFFIPNGAKMGVLDTAKSRVLLFDPLDKWPDPATTVSPLATAVFGQPDFHNVFPNAGPITYVPAPNAAALAQPFAAAFAGGELYIADTGNSRVVVVPFSATTGTFGTAATRLLGQDNFTMSAPNLIEGREFDFFIATTSGASADAGLAVDFNSDTPHLYVADPYNNRILGFKDFRKVAAGTKADIVLGQPDLNSGLCNITGNHDAPTSASLCRPIGVAVDGNGDLYVADSLNSRVLRFPAPFSHQGQLEPADLVLGQRNFTARVTDPTASTMSQPYGVTISNNNGLLVSDAAHNRVLYFPFTGNGTFRAQLDNGMAATKVLGSPDFNTPAGGQHRYHIQQPPPYRRR
jgi:sugar lactone lactonase YvrE